MVSVKLITARDHMYFPEARLNELGLDGDEEEELELELYDDELLDEDDALF